MFFLLFYVTEVMLVQLFVSLYCSTFFFFQNHHMNFSTTTFSYDRIVRKRKDKEKREGKKKMNSSLVLNISFYLRLSSTPEALINSILASEQIYYSFNW